MELAKSHLFSSTGSNVMPKTFRVVPSVLKSLGSVVSLRLGVDIESVPIFLNTALWASGRSGLDAPKDDKPGPSKILDILTFLRRYYLKGSTLHAGRFPLWSPSSRKETPPYLLTIAFGVKIVWVCCIPPFGSGHKT